MYNATTRLKILSAVLTLAVLSMACNLGTTVAAPVDEAATAQALETTIAQTVAAISLQTQAAIPPTDPPPAAPAAPTDAPAAPAAPTVRSVPALSVSTHTNCRAGPAEIYRWLGILDVDETADIIARDSGGNYWYIKNPNLDIGGNCWLWGFYATPVGDTQSLPVFTAMPPPTLTPTATNTPHPTHQSTTSKTPTGMVTYTVTYTPTPTLTPTP